MVQVSKSKSEASYAVKIKISQMEKIFNAAHSKLVLIKRNV